MHGNVFGVATPRVSGLRAHGPRPPDSVVRSRAQGSAFLKFNLAIFLIFIVQSHLSFSIILY